MNLHKYGHYIFFCITLLFITTNTIAKTQPKFTIIPTTPTSFTLSTQSTTTVRYQVTNSTQITRQLTMSPIPGVTQQTGSGVCSNPFTLAHGESCVLSLLVNGAQINNPTVGGPVICKTNGLNNNTPDPFLCSQPSESDSLHISTSSATFTIGGTISGLTQSGLVLQNNGGDNLNISASATTFQFNTPVNYGDSYNVTVLTQPTGQLCSVINSSGTNVTANVTNVRVVCSRTFFTIGGTISGLTTTGLELLNNGGDNLSVAANATTFQFSTSQIQGSTYDVTIGHQPQGLLCTVSNGSGTVTADVTNISVVCAAYVYLVDQGGAGSGNGNIIRCIFNNNTEMLESCVDAISDSTSVALNAPQNISFNPTASIAFVTNGGSNEVLSCSVIADGFLSNCINSGATLLNQPFGIVLNTGGTIAYITNNASGGGIIYCTVSGGNLSACTTSTATNLSEPSALTLNAANTLMFIINSFTSDITSCNVSGTTISGCAVLSSTTGSLGITFNTSNLNVLATDLSSNTVTGYDVSGNSLINPVSNTMPTLGGTAVGPTGILLNGLDTLALVNMFPLGPGGGGVVICHYNGQQTLSSCGSAGAPAPTVNYIGIGGFF